MFVADPAYHGVSPVQYSAREAAGVSALVGVSCFSLVAVLGLLFLMAVSAWSNRGSESKNFFFRTNVATYFVCLLIADLIQAVGAIMNAKWVEVGGVHHGNFCTTQGVLKHISDIGSATWSFVISVQTFCLLFYQLHSPRWVGWVVLVVINGLLVMFTFLGPAIYKTKASGEFYGVSGYWCWITSEYNEARVTLDYLIMFLSAFLSFILYTLVFFRLRGNIVVSGWHVRFRMLEEDESGWRGRDHASSRALSVARQMLLFPFAYTILFLPIAVLRMCEWAGHPISFEVTMFCDSVFLLGGIVNVVLFCTIRRVIPVKEVLVGIFTGKAFRKRVDEPQDTTWCIGTMEAGEKDITADVAVVASDDYFALRQPKFEIVTPPDQAAATTTTRTAQNVPTARTENVVPIDPPNTTIPTRRFAKPLPTAPSVHSEDEGSDRSSSFSHQSSFRKLPPVPRAPRSAPLLPVTEKRDSPPPPYRPDSSQHRYSISGAVQTHSHTGSYDSVVSDTPLLGVNRPSEEK